MSEKQASRSDRQPLLNQNSMKDEVSNKSVSRKASETSVKSVTSQKPQKPQESVRSTKTATNSVVSKVADASVSIVEKSKRKKIKGPKREDPHIYDCTCTYVFETIIYLVVLYVIVFALGAAIIALVYSRHHAIPRNFGKGSLLGGTPKLVIEPNPSFQDLKAYGKIKFNPSDSDTYLKLLTRMKTIQQKYVAGPTKCTSEERFKQKDGKYTDEMCNVEPYNSRNPYLAFGDCDLHNDTLENSEYAFGFRKGEPCLMLRFNKILGVYPKVEKTGFMHEGTEDQISVKPISKVNNTLNYTLAAEKRTLEGMCNGTAVEDCCAMRRFGFTCKADHDDVKFAYYPRLGASVCAYPFWGQDNFVQPFVMVKVKKLPVGKLVKITCTPAQDFWKTLDDDEENEARVYIEMTKKPQATRGS